MKTLLFSLTFFFLVIVEAQELKTTSKSKIIYPTGLTYTTTSSESFDGTTTSFGGDLIIEDGTSLIINDATLEFDADATLIIQEGGELILNTCTLTTFVCADMWPGVELLGSSTNHGNLEMYNNSAIENAHIGVLVGSRNQDYTVGSTLPLFQYSYATMIADYTNFNDCGYGVYTVRNSPNNLVFSSYGDHAISITNCVFETVSENLADLNYSFVLGAYPNDENPYVHNNYSGRGNTGITLQRTPRVHIDNNSFLNIETGIEQIIVRNDITNCEFDNLSYGIRGWGGYFNNYNPEHYYVQQSITGNIFTNISNPIYGENPSLLLLEEGLYEYMFTAAIELNGVQFFDLSNNDFGDPFDPDEFTENAIILDHAARFQINGNDINRARRGLVILDSQLYHEALDEQIWTYGSSLVGPSVSDDADKNKFFDCEVGIITNLDNGMLHLRCNDHDNGTLVDEKPYVTAWANRGVLMNQGFEAENGENNLAAGNRFFTTDENLIASTWQEPEGDEDPADYDYRYHSNIDDFPFIEPKVEEVLIEGEWTMVDVKKYIDNNQIYIPEISCNSIVTVNPGDGVNVKPSDFVGVITQKSLNVEGMVDELVELKASLDSWQTQTTAMLNAIYGGISDEMELRNYLTDNSPLSNEVLEAYMTRYNVPAEYFRDVVLLNSVVDNELENLLRIRVKDLPEAIQNEIEAVMQSNPDIETVAELNNKIKYEKSVIGLYFNEMMRFVDEEDDLVSILNEHREHVLDILFFTHLSQGEYSLAQVVLDDFIATTDDMNSWLWLANVQLDLAISGRSVFEMTSEERNGVETIFNESAMGDESRIMAEIMLAELGERQPSYIPALIETPTHRSAIAYTSLEDTKVKLWPNPASSYFEVEYALSNESHAQIRLTDALGRIVLTKALYPDSKRHLIEINDMERGNYLVEVLVNGKLVWTEKLVIQ